MQRDLALPISIFAGAVVIAIGLFLGLRARPPASTVTNAGGQSAPTDPVNAPQSPTARAPAGSGTITQAAPGAAPTPLMGATTPASDDKTSAVVIAELEKQKKSFVDACWKPAVEKQPKPAKATFAFSLTFDAQGVERLRAIQPLAFGAEGRPEVVACLQLLPTMLTVAATGQPFTVKTMVTLP